MAESNQKLINPTSKELRRDLCKSEYYLNLALQWLYIVYNLVKHHCFPSNLQINNIQAKIQKISLYLISTISLHKYILFVEVLLFLFKKKK
jgi:hypothetical protein